jgi:hypothetical protein
MSSDSSISAEADGHFEFQVIGRPTKPGSV